MNINFRKILDSTQEELKKTIYGWLLQSGYKKRKIKNQDGFLYAKGEIPVMLVAHLDTVHKNRPSIICKSSDGIYMSPSGIGGDDRCGVYMIMKIIQDLKCHVLFLEDEEIGCVGAEKFIDADIAPDINYMIELDRKGINDSVFYECDNKDFENFINSFGFKTANGLFSDISVIAPFLGVAAVNLSCGYFNPHTTSEYIDINVVNLNINRVVQIIETQSVFFEYVEKKRNTYHYSNSFYDQDQYGLKTNIDLCMVPSGYKFESWYYDDQELGLDYVIDSEYAIDEQNRIFALDWEDLNYYETDLEGDFVDDNGNYFMFNPKNAVSQIIDVYI